MLRRKIVPYRGNSGQNSILAGDGLSANDAVDGTYTAASRWRRIIGSKGEMQRADADVGGMKNASAQIGQTYW